MVARRLVDALIISATRRTDRRIELLEKARIPFVTLGRSASGGSYTWMDLDFEGVASRGVDRLVAKGHRRIAVAVPSSDINLGYLFLDAYRQTLQRHDIPFDPTLVIRVKSSEQGGYQAGHELLMIEQRPTAIILIHELMAIGLYRRLSEAGVVPGRDLAVVGFREEPRTHFLQPTLTSFRMSLRDLGAQLGETLLATMPAYADHYPQGARNRIWPLELIPGESDAFTLTT
jgi:DNA-binding LacI/PurR family transcriptional regulator